MVYTVFKASAPGSLMLMGEHAVLAGKLALCAAVDKRVHVSLTPRTDNNIVLTSNAFAPYQLSRETISIEKPYQFILASLTAYQTNLPSGCDIHVESEFSHTIGFGSSAAVTVAVVRVLREWLNLSLDLCDIMQSARTIVRHVQGRGSGADVAASAFGGVVAYHQDDHKPQVLTSLPAVTVVYCGYKTTTPDVIKLVFERFHHKADELNTIYERIDQCTQQAVKAWQAEDWREVGKLMSQHFKLQQELGVSDEALDHIVKILQQQPSCLGAKISGSGLGDCAIGLGKITQQLFPDEKLAEAQQFAITLSSLGISVE